jgi:hypothetical protein
MLKAEIRTTDYGPLSDYWSRLLLFNVVARGKLTQ